MMNVMNPATGQLIAQLATDDAASIATKMDAARAAQAAWAAEPVSRTINQARRMHVLLGSF